jgi:hypothetical protein
VVSSSASDPPSQRCPNSIYARHLYARRSQNRTSQGQ